MADSLTGVIQPLRSRCLCIRVPLPEYADVAKALHQVARAEGFVLPEQVATDVALACRRNLRKAILMLQCLKTHTRGPLTNEV